MVTPIRQLETGSIYHIFNRGVEKRVSFLDELDYVRFLRSLVFYQQQKPNGRFSWNEFSVQDRKEPLRFDILAYVFMPNHFHLLVRQLVDNGIREGIGQLLTSYTKYFNTRYDRVGPLFQGRYRSKAIDRDEVLVHGARYIMLNATVANLTPTINYRWSSLDDYRRDEPLVCETTTILGYFDNDRNHFERFLTDHADHARSLARTKRDIFA